MIIRRIIINNFKCYVGENIFDLNVTPDRNVILIGGINGGGKTSLSEAICLCLYGSKTNGAVMSEARYQEFLTEMWSTKTKENTMSVTMDVVMDDSNPPMELTVSRSFKRKGNKIVENLSLTKGGEDVEIIDREYWEYYIQQLIPSELSRYYFFDGEKIQKRLLDDDADDYMRTAIGDVTGITKKTVLANDLVELRRRLLRNDIKPATKKRIDGLEKRILELSELVESDKSAMEAINAEKTKLVEEQNSYIREYNRVVGMKSEKIKFLKQEYDGLDFDLTAISEQVTEYAYCRLPKVVMRGLIRDICDEAVLENESIYRGMIDGYISKTLDAWNGKVPGASVDDGFDIRTWLKQEVFHLGSEPSGPEAMAILDLTPSQIEDLRSQMDEDGSEGYFRTYLINRENLTIARDNLGKELSKARDESQADYEKMISNLDDRINELDQQMWTINGSIEARQDEIEKNRNHIIDEENKLVLNDRDKAVIENIDLVIETLHKRVDEEFRTKLVDFNNVLNEIYSILKNKKDMVSRVELKEDFNISMIGFDGTPINYRLISEGEKGILMYSIMYALVSLAKFNLPLIIDSPLGKMDSIHVDHLMSYLYPNMGNQVIILSHDREITPALVPKLDPVISKKYRLNPVGQPRIVEGYFE